MTSKTADHVIESGPIDTPHKTKSEMFSLVRVWLIEEKITTQMKE